MSEDDKRDRKFQYALTKAQVDFEFWFALSIGILAIGYTLFSYYKDNLLGIIATDGLLLVAVIFLVRVYNIKEQRFKDIKKEYIDN
jgi:CHASE2 domain-containing sensor protein